MAIIIHRYRYPLLTMQGNSRSISTTQIDVHDKLPEVVLRHKNSVNQKPIQQHTQTAFESVSNWLTQFPHPKIILDSCCGIGESTWRLAKQHPDSVVIGIDKSEVRVNKHGKQQEYRELNPSSSEPDINEANQNYRVVRADVIDFWRLVRRAQWQVTQHYLLYPNPYPKSAQLQKRWHASASLQDIIAIGGKLTVRSNWQVYIEEFARALRLCGHQAEVKLVEQVAPITPFERKYWNSGQQSWQLDSDL